MRELKDNMLTRWGGEHHGHSVDLLSPGVVHSTDNSGCRYLIFVVFLFFDVCTVDQMLRCQNTPVSPEKCVFIWCLEWCCFTHEDVKQNINRTNGVNVRWGRIGTALQSNPHIFCTLIWVQLGFFCLKFFVIYDKLVTRAARQSFYAITKQLLINPIIL